MENNVAVGWAQPLRQAFVRVCVHSIVYAPFSIASVFVWTAAANGHGLSAPRFSQVVPVWAAGSAFWVPTMLCVYRFVPLHARVVVTSVCNVGWSSYLSLKSAISKNIK